MKNIHFDSSALHSNRKDSRTQFGLTHNHKVELRKFKVANERQYFEVARDVYSFADAINLAIFNAELKEQIDAADTHCPLAVLPYETELSIKKDAVKSFFRVYNLPDELIESVIPSPIGRPCRTTSKRRVFIDRRRHVRFTMGYSGSQRIATIKSPLEPESHGQIFNFLHVTLNSPAYFALARYLNFIVIRGNYEHLAVIFNLFRLDAGAMRKIHAIADKFKEKFPIIQSMFTFLDESRSEFYLESKVTSHPFRKIFGPEMLDITVNGMKFLFPPGAFSQVNESILPCFLAEAAKMAELNENITFYDLYCGYGLFGISVAQKAKSVIGIDFNGPAILAASDNAEHIISRRNVRFIPSAVTLKSITEKLPPEANDEVFFLDPPRNGVASNVIEAIAERNPLRVIHVFCSTDEIPHSLRAWKNAGYVPVKVSVFDMFPGTSNVETMFLLSKCSKKKIRSFEKKHETRTVHKTNYKQISKKEFGKRKMKQNFSNRSVRQKKSNPAKHFRKTDELQSRERSEYF